MQGALCLQALRLEGVASSKGSEHQPARASPRTCSMHPTSDGTKRQADGDSKLRMKPASEDAKNVEEGSETKVPGGSQMPSMQPPKSNFPCKRAGTAEQSGTAEVGSVGVGTDETFDSGCVRAARIATLLSRWRP